MPSPVITDEARKVADLRADPRNARRHSEAQIAQIMASIEEFGFLERVLIRPDGMVIGGHGRLEALKRLERETVEVRVVDGLTDRQYTALSLALNKIPENSAWNDDALREIFTDMQADGNDVIGFSPTEIDKLLADDEPLEVKEIETGDVDDEFWISVRGPLKHQADALRALDAAMKPFAGVSVEGNTINIG